MNIEVPTRVVSDTFWAELARRWRYRRFHHEIGFLEHSAKQREDKIEGMKTGSITSATGYALALLVEEMRPDVVVEVGTYIGFSTEILASQSKRVYTCDKDFSVDIGRENVTQFLKTTSTDMLKALMELGVVADLFFVDGRLVRGDISYLLRIMSDQCVFALDDCEGIEKGHANALLLDANIKGGIFLPPPSDGILDVRGRCTVGLFVPNNIITISRQG